MSIRSIFIKMKILKPTQNVLKFIGLLFTYSHSRWYAFRGIVLLLLCSSLTYPFVSVSLKFLTAPPYCNIFSFTSNSIQAVSFVENIKNVTRFSEIMSIFSGELSAMAKVTIFLSNKRIFRNLMNGLESIIDQSVYCRG